MSFWNDLEWLENLLPRMGLTAVYALALMTFCAFMRERFFTRRRTQITGDNNNFNTQTNRFYRKLGTVENLWFERQKRNNGTQSIVLFLKSKVPLDIKLVRESFVLLIKRHPLLAVKVDSYEETGGPRNSRSVRYFKEMEEPMVDLAIKRTYANEWKEKFQRELSKSFSSSQVAKGPLWRVAVLKENFLRSEEVYKNAIIITAHPTICDGISLVKLCDQFLQIMNSQFSQVNNIRGGSASASSMGLGVEYPMRPTLSDLLRHVVAVSSAGQLFLACQVVLQGFLKMFMGRVKNQFTLVFPPPRFLETSIVRKTNVIPLSLSREMTQRLVQNCKQKGCTVHAVVIAVSSIATATVLQSGKLRIPMNIPFLFDWSVRKNCQPQIDDDEFGSFVLGCKNEIPVQVVDIGSQNFWDFVVACMKKLHGVISKGDLFQELKVLNALSVKPKGTSQHEDALFRLSSIGQHEITEDSDSTYRFDGVQLASEVDNVGPVFSNSVVSVNGEMYWSISYSARVVTDKLAKAIADNVLDILIKICSSS